jgi:hypothetical protein
VLAGTAGDPGRVQVSKLHFNGEGMAWNPTIDVRLEDRSGPVVAAAALNETVVLFTESQIYRVDGDGPNNAGAPPYPEPRLVATDVGCVEPRSVVVFGGGVMFKSAKGIYLLGQNLVPVYVGADVERFNSQAITDATLCPDVNQVRFLTDSGRVLVFDYLFGQWTTFNSHEGVAAALWRGGYAYARVDGSVGLETPGEYQDFGASFTMAVETAWIHVAGLQGYQRTRAAMLLGRYLSPHKLRVSWAYDFEHGLPNVAEWQPSGVINTSIYGESTPYGAETPYGGSGSSTYQAEFYLNKQKCESVRLRIEDVITTTAGASFELADLTMQVGGMSGLFRLGPGRKVG